MENNIILMEKILSDFKDSDFYKKGIRLDNTKPRVVSINYIEDGCKQEDEFHIHVNMSEQEMHFKDHFDEPIDILSGSIEDIINNMSDEQFNDVYISIPNETKSKIREHWGCLLGTNPSDQEIRELILEMYIEICFINFLKDSNEELIKLSFKDLFEHRGYNI